MAIVSIDGVVVPPERAVVSVFDRGFLYGDGVFEVLRTYGGEPFALEEHLARLEASLARVHMRPHIARQALAGEVRATLAAAAHGESYVRIMVTRGVAPLGLDLDLAKGATRVILAAPLSLPPRATYADGARAITCEASRPFADAKQLGYLPSIVLLHEARARGASEALLVDAHGNVLEGAASNVFIVHGGALLTPREGAILAGITRAHVLAAASALGVRVEVTDVPRARLLDASEVFVTSSIRELVPIVAVDDRTIGAGFPGPLTRALHRAFRARVAEAVGAPATGAPLPWE
jgi:branched-chain amino acid aminotransferase